jgi:hypothetical protein
LVLPAPQDSVEFAPADTFETVNTLGLPLYARMIPDRDRDEWVRLGIESNPLPICTRPQMLRSARMLAQRLRAGGADPDAPGLTFDRLWGGKGAAGQHGKVRAPGRIADRAVADDPGTDRAVRIGQRLAGRVFGEVGPDRMIRGQCPGLQVDRHGRCDLRREGGVLGRIVGREVGREAIGAMPHARAVLLGPAISLFRKRWKTLPVRVIDGTYADLALTLRRGEMDVLVGALRPAASDLIQEVLFQDELAIVARPGHPPAQRSAKPAAMVAYPWVVAAEGNPPATISRRCSAPRSRRFPKVW